MTKAPWAADRPLDAELARRVVRARIPGVAARTVEPLGSGWDNDVFLVDGVWIVRFPRRREVAEALAVEVGSGVLAAEALAPLGVEVPRIEEVSGGGDGFPYAIGRYRALPGRAAGDVPEDGSEVRELGRQIGGVLAALHAVDIEVALAHGAGYDMDGAVEWLHEARRVAGDLAARDRDPTVRSALSWLDSGPEIPASSETRVFLHNDLCPDHVLLSDDGRISGLLDFGDVALGDPALDFHTVAAWLGPEGLAAALTAYGPAPDVGFTGRVRFLARVCSLSWLHDAHLREADPSGLEKHRRWVERAFAG